MAQSWPGVGRPSVPRTTAIGRSTHRRTRTPIYLKYAGYWANSPSSFNLKDFQFTVATYDKLLPLAGIYDSDGP